MKSRLEEKLRIELKPFHLDVVDDSASHIGHVGAHPSGETHFSVLVVSDKFIGIKPLERHRMIYKIINSEFNSSLHALAIQSFTCEEYDRQTT